jgi:hypothetical protein
MGILYMSRPGEISSAVNNMSRLLLLGLAVFKIFAAPLQDDACAPDIEVEVLTTLVVAPVLISTYVASPTVLTFGDQITVTVTKPTQLSIATATTDTIIRTQTM